MFFIALFGLRSPGFAKAATSGIIWFAVKNRREFILSAAAAPAVLKSAAGRTNVVFLVADDLRTALACYGNPIVRTPHIDRLAARSVLFDRAYCQFPLCAPSRASFLSGRRPGKTGVWTLRIPTRQYLGDAVMLPELFRKAGYRTADFGKIFHNGPDHDDSRSWDIMKTGAGSRVPSQPEIIEGHIMARPRNHTMQWARLKTPDDDLTDFRTAQQAADFIRSSAREQTPFFLGAGFYVPHSPYVAPSKYFDLYDSSKIPLPAAPRESVAALPAAAWYELADQVPPTPEQARQYIAAYYACVSFLDAQIGRILAALDETGLWRNTVVVFFSDHGYHLGEHGMWHKMTLFEESTRVPLVIHAPGMAAGKRCSSLVELIDLYPTLAQLCAIKPPAGLDGSSLAPQLRNPSTPARRAVFSSVNRHEDRSRLTSAFSFFGHSVRTERWRYTEWDNGSRGVELYDERNDPGELRNLASDPKHSNVRSDLKRLLQPHAFRADSPPAA
jgi:uncharacterized sulfatase